MRIGGLLITRDRESAVSSNGWLGMYGCWLHIDDTLLGLIWQMITEFKHDRHMVG
jgi:hypothetical protein